MKRVITYITLILIFLTAKGGTLHLFIHSFHFSGVEGPGKTSKTSQTFLFLLHKHAAIRNVDSGFQTAPTCEFALSGLNASHSTK